VPRTHDLEDLLDLLLPHDPTLKPLRRGLGSLTRYAVEYRYPGCEPGPAKWRPRCGSPSACEWSCERDLDCRFHEAAMAKCVFKRLPKNRKKDR
jgi:hypothetical protein